MKRALNMMLLVAVAGLLTTGSATAETVSCLASAGLTKAAAAKTSPSAERRGSYDVKVSTNGDRAGAIVVAVKPHSPDAVATSTQTSGRIDRVLLRSPYKSEAIAQPSSFAHGADEMEAVATFDTDAVRELPAGDVNVILFTPDGERMCRLKKSERSSLGAAGKAGR